jgi:hypothetical protein
MQEWSGDLSTRGYYYRCRHTPFGRFQEEIWACTAVVREHFSQSVINGED